MTIWGDVFDKYRRRGYDLSMCAKKADEWAYKNRCRQCGGHGKEHPYQINYCQKCKGTGIEP